MLSLWGLLAPFALCAQQTSPSQAVYYTLNDGLSDRLVTDVLQSRLGFVWVATTNGLNRFDGYEFVTFGKSNSASQRPILSAIDLKEIHEDKLGNIVLLYQNGFAFFDILNPYTHQVKKVVPFQQEVRGIIRHVTVDQAGDLLLMVTSQTGVEVWQYDYEAEKLFQRFELKEGRTDTGTIAQMLHCRNGNFLLNDSEKGLRLVNAGGSVVKTYKATDFGIKPGSAQQYPSATWFLREDRKGIVRIAFKNIPGVYNLVPENSGNYSVTRILEKEIISYLSEDRKGNLLFVASNGIGAYPQPKKIYFCDPDQKIQEAQHLLIANEIYTCVYSNDFSKTIFMGMDTGLKIVRNNRSGVKSFLAQNLDAPNQQRGAVMRGMTGNGKGQLYIARESLHWYVLDTKTDQLDTLQLIDQATNQPINFTCGLDLFLLRHQLWGITCYYSNQGQLLLYDTEKCTTKRFLHKDNFRAFTVTRNGAFWLLCESHNGEGSLVRFNPITEKFTVFANPDGGNPLKKVVPRYITEARDGTIWIGTEDGLFRFDQKAKILEKYADSSEGGKLTLSDYTIYVIYEDPMGKLWLGTKNGLNVCDLNTKKVEIYNKIKGGMASNTVCGILPDEKGNYWISTFNGLSYFDTKAQNFRNFFQSDGLTHDEFNRFSFYKDETGRYYFGGVNGLNVFYPNDLLNDAPTPAPILTKIVRFNSAKDSLLTQYETEIAESITIDPSDTYFLIHFALPDFGNPRKSQYMARLEGFDSDWSYLGFSNNIRFNSLPPGKYTLHVRGVPPNGNWSAADLRIPIVVNKPFYSRALFYILMGLLIVGGIYAFTTNRLKQQLSIEKLRMKLSSDLHDEVSGLLSGIAMQSDMLQMKIQDEDSKARLHTIGEASRKAMSKLSDVIWAIDSRKDKVEDLIQRMREHADDMLLPMDVTYELKIEKIDLQEKMPVHLRQNLYFIYNEAINNIAKHANATKVWVEFVNAGNIFEMSIKDNGNGRARSSFKTGQGLSNIQMRAQRLNASLQIIRDNGYTVRLTMKKFA
ncbi:MAG: two-component regulator propeller domain-containing protein [Saprospiraceae bacterium]